MPNIRFIMLEVDDVPAGERFYAAALGTIPQLRLRESHAATNGFRGFTLSVDVAHPAAVDHYMTRALRAGAKELKPASKQFWGGYSGVFEAPDGTVWKVATAAKKDDDKFEPEIESIVILLGVSDFRRSRQFYCERGLTVAKSFGTKYLDFHADHGAVKLGLYKRAGLAKDAAVPAYGHGSHRVAIVTEAAGFVDPDEFRWEAASVVNGTASR